MFSILSLEPTPTAPYSHSMTPPPTTAALASSTTMPTNTTPEKPVRLICEPLTLPISPEPFLNQRLKGRVILREGAFSEIQCEDYCLRFPSCVAYNFHYNDGHDGGKMDCELLDRTDGFYGAGGFLFRIFERERASKVGFCISFCVSVCHYVCLSRKKAGGVR